MGLKAIFYQNIIIELKVLLLLLLYSCVKFKGFNGFAIMCLKVYIILYMI